MRFLDRVITQLNEQPRAIQWALYAAMGMALFLIWDQAVAPISEQWKRDADVIQTKLQQVRAGADLIDRFDTMKDKISGIGPVEIPPGKKQGQESILRAINEVLRNHTVSDESISTTDGKRFRSGTLSKIAGSKRIESLKVDFEYVATPEVAIAIISELEANPEIEFIRTIRLSKEPNQKIKVQLTFEKWVMGSRS